MNSFRKSMKNKVGRAFIKNVDKLEVISNNDVTDRLDEVCVERFKKNKEEYRKFKRVLNLKLFLKYDLPLITFLLGSSFAFKTEREVSVVPYYNLEQTMISDGKIVTDFDDNDYIVVPKGKEVDSNFIEIDDADNMVQYQVKNGTRSAIVTIKIDGEGEMSVVDSLVGNFFDRNSDIFDDIETTTLDEKYQELVDDIGDFVLNSENLTSTSKKEIKKFLESEKTTIITTVAEYVEAGKIELEDTEGHWIGEVVIAEFIVGLVALMVSLLSRFVLGSSEIKRLDRDDDEVRYCTSGYTWNVKLFTTAQDAKTVFLRADENRVNKVKRLVRENLSESSQKFFEK